MHSIVWCLSGLAAASLIGTAAAQESAPQHSLRSVVNSAESVPPPPATTESAPAAPTSEELAKSASLLLRVAQLMVVRLEGMYSPSAADRQLLDQVPPGAVVIPHVLAPESFATYVTALRTRVTPGPQPLMIGIDLIGAGRAAEPGAPHGMRIPAMLTTAAVGPGSRTAALYAAQASDLAILGVDFHWGPSLGLAPSIEGEITLTDSFGAEPATAAAFATQIGQALEQRNVAWAPGGFPGGVPAASSRSPAVLLTPRSQLREQDLRPYEAAIAAGADMIHVGTTLVPTLDSNRPACLSPIVIGEALRGALGFEGIIVAGPMDSPHVSRITDTSTAAVEALLSGADMIYWEGSGPRVARAIVDIVQAVQRDILPESVIDRAYDRILSYKTSRGLSQWPAPDMRTVRNLAKEAARRPEPAEVERGAITLLRNRNALLPLNPELPQSIGVTGVYGVQELKEALEEYYKVVVHQGIRTARHATRIQDFEIERLTRSPAGVNVAIVTLSGDIELAGQIKLIRGLKGKGTRVVVVLLGQPKNLAAYEEADALLLAYGDIAKPGDTMIALADVLVGIAPVEVLPPMRELELRAGELAQFNVQDVVRTPSGRLPLSLGGPFDAGYGISYRSDSVFETVRWDFGDGKQSRDPVTSHAYKSPGSYEVKLRVGDKYPAEGAFRVVVK